MTVTEISTNSVTAPTALPRAPINGFYERTAAGDLPKMGPDGRSPAEAYARPFTAVPGTPRVSLIVGGLVVFVIGAVLVASKVSALKKDWH